MSKTQRLVKWLYRHHYAICDDWGEPIALEEILDDVLPQFEEDDAVEREVRRGLRCMKEKGDNENAPKHYSRAVD